MLTPRKGVKLSVRDTASYRVERCNINTSNIINNTINIYNNNSKVLVSITALSHVVSITERQENGSTL